MKRIRNSTSSASEKEFSLYYPHQELVIDNKKRNLFKPERIQLCFDTKGSIMTEEEVIPEESFAFKELGMILKSFKQQTSLQFNRLSTM